MKRRIIAKHLTNLNSQKRVENHAKGKSCAPFYFKLSLNISYRTSNIPAHEFFTSKTGFFGDSRFPGTYLNGCPNNRA